MKTCEPFELLLSRSLDNDLSNKDSKKLLTHLSRCSHCRTKAKQFLVLRNAFDGENKNQLQELMNNMPVIELKPRKISWQRYSQVAAVFLAVLSIVGYQGFQNLQKKKSTEVYIFTSDYPMTGILTYEQKEEESFIDNVYMENYTSGFDSYFNYVGYGE